MVGFTVRAEVGLEQSVGLAELRLKYRDGTHGSRAHDMLTLC